MTSLYLWFAILLSIWGLWGSDKGNLCRTVFWRRQWRWRIRWWGVWIIRWWLQKTPLCLQRCDQREATVWSSWCSCCRVNQSLPRENPLQSKSRVHCGCHLWCWLSLVETSANTSSSLAQISCTDHIYDAVALHLDLFRHHQENLACHMEWWRSQVILELVGDCRHQSGYWSCGNPDTKHLRSEVVSVSFQKEHSSGGPRTTQSACEHGAWKSHPHPRPGMGRFEIFQIVLFRVFRGSRRW